MIGAPISRRRALGLIGLGTAGVAVGATGWATGVGAPSRGTSGQDLAQPPVLASRDGVLEVSLTAAPGVRLAGRETLAWGYNGTCPGPTLRVRPGDLLRVRRVLLVERSCHYQRVPVRMGGTGVSRPPTGPFGLPQTWPGRAPLAAPGLVRGERGRQCQEDAVRIYGVRVTGAGRRRRPGR